MPVINKVTPLAQDYIKIFESPNPESVFCYSPGIACLENGRLVVSLDLGGPGVKDLNGPKRVIEGGGWWFGKVFTSDDDGATWTHRTDFPFMHARPFLAGNSVYVLGHCNDLMIIRSDDGGDTWTEPVSLTSGQVWHQAPCNVQYSKGNIYLVMERICYGDVKGWAVSAIAPVLMRGDAGSDLTKRENWTFASELVFRDTVEEKELEYFGVPFYSTPSKESSMVAPKRGCAPMGWLESNVVQFTDLDHYLYDPEKKTFHLWMRAHTGGTGYAAVLKVVEQEDGTMETMPETVPSGKKLLYAPCPGGHMKFHILYDEITKLYWLLSSQPTDSMTRAERLPENRFNLPNNERHRLQLCFSRNCMDWCFAGLVAMGNSPKEARHYASMAFKGEDLLIVSRSGNEQASSAHNGNIISFHRIKNFRELVY